MKYTLSWQDFMRQPENKQLKENKGIHACKQKFIQEQNKLMWHDPTIITEAAQDAGVTNNVNAPYSGSTSFVTGNASQVATFTWDLNLPHFITGSGGNFKIEGHFLTNETSFTADHTDIRKSYAILFTSGSVTSSAGLGTGLTGFSSTGYDMIVTASSAFIPAAGNSTLFASTGSWAKTLLDAVSSQASNASVLEFTNTIAPSTAISIATGSGGETFTITNVVKGSIPSGTEDYNSGSISLTTKGMDTFHDDQGAQLFDAQQKPYSYMPRKDN